MCISRPFARFFFFFLLAFACSMAACQQELPRHRISLPASIHNDTPSTLVPKQAPTSNREPHALAGIRWTPAKGWDVLGSSGMRAQSYRIRPVLGDKESSDCAFYYFGRMQGGSVEANLQRWIGQFVAPSATTQRTSQITAKRARDGIQFTRLDVVGTFLWTATPMSEKTTPKANYRMLGAIVEAPQGRVFIKCVGPVRTLTHAKRAFDRMLSSIRIAR